MSPDARRRNRLARAAPWIAAAWLAACGNNPDWREFESAEGRFRITLPGKAAHDKRTLTSPAGTVVMHMDSVNLGDTLFGVGYADYPPDYLKRVQTDAIVTTVRDALLRNVGGRNMTESPAARGRYLGRSVHAEGRNGDRVLTLDALLIFAGGRFYQVVAIGEAGQISRNDLDLYFGSFRIAE